jgi:hypothetical protein
VDCNYPNGPSKYTPGKDSKLQQFGRKDHDDDDDSPFKERDKKPGFSAESQRESKRKGNELDSFTPHIKDPAVLDQILEAVNLLHGLADSRQSRDSTDPLGDHELDAIDKSEKALRSILDGKRRRFPERDASRGSPPNRGQKGVSLDALFKETQKQTKDISAIDRTLKDLMETL